MVLASIITYNSDINKLDKTISSIAGQVSELLIVDNNSNNISDIDQLIAKYDQKKICKIHIKKNKTNQGIAAALNQVLNYAAEKSYVWVLTLDQDSECIADMVDQMLFYHQHGQDNEKTIIISPSYTDINITTKIEKRDTGNGARSVLTTITSGSLTNVNFALEIGGFMDKLFIDHVDHEFCLRAKKMGFSIIELADLELKHEIGHATQHRFLHKIVSTSNHSALRRYYLFRNSIWLFRKYFRDFPRWTLIAMRWNMVIFLRILLYEDDKLIKLNYIFKGVMDGFMNKLGPFRH